MASCMLISWLRVHTHTSCAHSLQHTHTYTHTGAAKSALPPQQDSQIVNGTSIIHTVFSPLRPAWCSFFFFSPFFFALSAFFFSFSARLCRS
jgi:hypothetical protein